MIISASSACDALLEVYQRCGRSENKTPEEPQACVELHKVLVDASDDARDGRRAGYAARAGMRDVDSDEDGGLLGKPAESVAGRVVVDLTELGVDLESDVGQILVLLALVERFFEEQALRAYAEFHRAQPPFFCSKERMKLMFFASPNDSIVREMFSSARRCPGSSLTNGSWSVARIAGGSLPTAVLAPVVERLGKVDQTAGVAVGSQGIVALSHGFDVPAEPAHVWHASISAIRVVILMLVPGPLKLSASMPSHTTRTFQFLIRPPTWNLESRIFQLPFCTRGTPLPCVTLGGGSSQPGTMTIWRAMRMLNELSTAVAGL